MSDAWEKQKEKRRTPLPPALCPQPGTHSRPLQHTDGMSEQSSSALTQETKAGAHLCPWGNGSSGVYRSLWCLQK